MQGSFSGVMSDDGFCDTCERRFSAHGVGGGTLGGENIRGARGCGVIRAPGRPPSGGTPPPEAAVRLPGAGQGRFHHPTLKALKALKALKVLKAQRP